MQTSDNNKSSEAEKERFTDKRTNDRIREHLTNEKDNISADDISNVQSDINKPQVENAPAMDDEKVIENKGDVEYNGKDDDDKDKPKDITPWNVID